MSAKLTKEELEQKLTVLSDICEQLGWSLSIGYDSSMEHVIGMILGEHEYVVAIMTAANSLVDPNAEGVSEQDDAQIPLLTSDDDDSNGTVH